VFVRIVDDNPANFQQILFELPSLEANFQIDLFRLQTKILTETIYFSILFDFIPRPDRSLIVLWD